MAEEKNTPFNYLLNAFEHASQEKYPAKAGYAGKRKALLAHVRELERKAAAYDALAAPAPSAPADQPSPDKQGQQGAARFEQPEEFCGLQQMVSDRETRAGTKYETVRWTCPNCGKACSCINVDGEWCHGDVLSISFGPEKDADGTWTRHHKCTACWLAASHAPTEEPRTDGVKGLDDAQG